MFNNLNQLLGSYL